MWRLTADLETDQPVRENNDCPVPGSVGTVGLGHKGGCSRRVMEKKHSCWRKGESVSAWPRGSSLLGSLS